MIPFRTVLGALHENEVACVIVGGVAAILHGSARVTFDLDLVYDRSAENMKRIVQTLSPFKPYLRGAPAGLPFLFDVKTLKQGLNFTLTTTEGPIDLLGELTGIGDYEAVREHALTAQLFGSTHQFLDLQTLILSKKAAGRPKDLEVIAELESIREERR